MIQMTAEEYEKKYGVPPPIPSSKPPLKMTQEEYDAKYSKPVTPKFDVPEPDWNRKNKIAEYQAEAQVYQKEADKYNFKKNPIMALGTYANQVAGDFFAGTRAIKDTLSQTVGINAGKLDGYVEAERANIDARINLLKAIREKEAKGEDATKLKQYYNLNVDDGEKLKQTIQTKSVVPSTLRTSAQLVQMAIEVLSIGTYGSSKGALAGMESGKLAPKTLPTALQGLKDWANRPAGLFTKKGLERVAEGGVFGYAYDVASGFAGDRGEDRTGTSAFIPGVVTAFGLAIPGMIGAGKTLGNVLTKSGRESVIVEKRIGALDQLERDNAKVREAFNDFRAKVGQDPIQILANTEALNDAVDSNGTITMNNALSKLNEIINKEDSVVYDTLVREGTTIGVPQFVGSLFDGVRTSDLQLTERNLLIKEVRRLADNIRYSVDANGKVPLASVHKAKISLGQKINKQWGTNKGTVNKELYRIYKRMVEDFSESMDVQQHNKGLSDAYELRNVFSVLQGKKVEGGRLGKHVSSAIGASLGMATHNPLVGLAGAKAGSVIRGRQLKGTFGGKIDKKFVRSTPTPKKKTTTSKRSVDTMKNRGILTGLKDKVTKERAKIRSMVRQTGEKGSIGGEGAQPEPSRKLPVNQNVAINERMQIIDPTRNGADALLGTMGDLSSELRSAVIKAKKDGDMGVMKMLLPKIIAELDAKNARRSQASTLTPEQIAQNKLAKAQARLLEFKNDSKTLEIGLSPVEGVKRTRWSEAHDEAMALFKSGDTDGAYKKFAQIHTEVVAHLKKLLVGAPFEKDVSFKDLSFGVFEGKPEINVGMTAKIKDADMEMFHQFLIDVSNRDLYQKSVLTYKHQPHSPDLPYGVIDEAKGITRDPLWSFFPTEPLGLPQIKLFNEALAEAGLPFMSIKDNGKRVDILELTAYSDNYEGFFTKIGDLKESLDRKGISGSSELYGTETRLIGDTSGPTNITYGRSKRDFLKNNPTALRGNETIDSGVLDKLRYRTSVTKAEFRELLNQLPEKSPERLVYEDIIKKYPEDAKISPRSLYKLLEKKVLKLTPGGPMESYSEYGWDRLLGNTRGEYELKTQKIDAELPVSLDRVTHTGSGGKAQFGHFRYAVRVLKKMKEVFFGETQNDTFQQSRKFDVVKDAVRKKAPETSVEETKISINRLKMRIDTARGNIVRMNQEITDSLAGNDMNHRVVSEGRNVVEKLKEFVREQGGHTDSSNTDALNASGFTHITSIIPDIRDGVKGYAISLSMKTPGGNARALSTFIKSLDQEGEFIVGDNGLQQNLNITDGPRGGPNGRGSLEGLVNERAETLQADTERWIRGKRDSIAREKNDILSYQQDLARLRKQISRLKSKKAPPEDFKGEQFLNFKKDDKFVLRQLQEEIEHVIETEKPKRIYIPTPSTVAKIEGYFPNKTESAIKAPEYSYNGTFGPGVAELPVGTKIYVGEEPHIVLNSRDVIHTLPKKDVTIKLLAEGKKKASAIVKQKYRESVLSFIKKKYEDRAEWPDLPEARARVEKLSQADENTVIDDIDRQRLFYKLPYPASNAFSEGRGVPEFWGGWRRDKTHTIREVIDNYLKKEKAFDQYVVDFALSGLSETRTKVVQEGNSYYSYTYPSEKQMSRFQQPSRYSTEPVVEKSYEQEFDSNRKVIEQDMSDGSSQAVVLHRFDDMKTIWPQLENQFGQKLTPWTDPKTKNTWVYFTPDYSDPRWKNIKKTTF